MSQDSPSIIHSALRYLADRCNYASTWDGQGFNKFDADFGHDLARKDSLTFNQKRAAVKMMRKYRGQLETGGFRMGLLDGELAVSESENGSSPARRTIEVVGAHFVLRSPYDKGLVEAIKSIDGAQFKREDNKAWHVPITRGQEVMSLAHDWKFEFVESSTSPATDAPPAEEPKESKRTIDLEGDQFVLRSPYDKELVEAMRHLPGRDWKKDRKVNLVPIFAREPLQKFADEHGFEWTDAARNVQPIKPPREIDVASNGERALTISWERGDPEFVDMLEAMRRMPERRWSSTLRTNVVPAAECLEVERFGRRFEFDFSDQALALIEEKREEAERQQGLIEEMTAASWAKEPRELDLDAFGLTGLFDFQTAGVEYMLNMRNGINGDDPGLGKTVQALATLEASEIDEPGSAYPALVIGPRTMVREWAREIREWHAKWGVERSVQIVTANSQVGEADITLVHYDILPKRLVNALYHMRFVSLVFDEGHLCKNRKALRTESTRALADKLDHPNPIIIDLSGTALVNRPYELIPQLEITRRLDDIGGYHHFYKHYCGSDQRGAQNLNELSVALRTNCMVRRLKPDVLPQLPPKIYTPVPLELDNLREYRFAEDDFLDWVRETGGDVFKAERAETLTRLNALRRLCADGKLSSSLEWIKTRLEGGEKLVVFAHHRHIQRRVLDELQEFNPRVISSDQRGEKGDIDREQNRTDFQTDESVRVIVVSLEAGGLGITLTASSDAVLLELPWTPKSLIQAVDRCHRIGQQDSVTGWEHVSPGSVDDFMADLLNEKAKIMGQALDGQAPAEADKSIMVEVVNRMLEADDERKAA